MDLDDEELKETRKLKGLDNICLHCNNNKANYCEECYQDLISENMKLKYTILELQKRNSELQDEILDYDVNYIDLDEHNEEIEKYEETLEDISNIIESLAKEIEFYELRKIKEFPIERLKDLIKIIETEV